MPMILDKYYAFKFIYLLTQKWEETEAFKQGILDKNGKELKRIKKLKTQDEKSAYTRFHKLIYSIKRMLSNVPMAQSTIGRYSTALLLIKEETGYLFDEEFLEVARENVLTESVSHTKIVSLLKSSIEEFSGIGGVDMGAGGLPLNKRKHGLGEDNGDCSFAGDAVFDCDSTAFQDSRMGKKKYLKYRTYVGNDKVGERIRQYGLKHPRKGIVLRDSITGAMLYLRRRS